MASLSNLSLQLRSVNPESLKEEKEEDGVANRSSSSVVAVDAFFLAGVAANRCSSILGRDVFFLASAGVDVLGHGCFLFTGVETRRF